MNRAIVAPAEAGVPRPSRPRSGVPDFAGMTRWFALALLAFSLLATPAFAQTFPKLTGRVVDAAHILRPEQVVDLTSKSEALEAQTGRQFVVATVPGLEGRTIEDYGYRLGRTWGIGEKGKDDGVILLVAPNEKKVRIETGYGARVFLTDAVSSVIIREAIVPRFKAGDLPGGIMAGADEIIRQMSLPAGEAQRNVQQAEQRTEQRQHSGAGALPMIFWFMIVAFVLLSFIRRASGRRYRSRRSGISPWIVLWGLSELSRGSRGGWGGGGGFSGGGGSFGGGGASGSW